MIPRELEDDPLRRFPLVLGEVNLSDVFKRNLLLYASLMEMDCRGRQDSGTYQLLWVCCRSNSKILTRLSQVESHAQQDIMLIKPSLSNIGLNVDSSSYEFNVCPS